METIYSFNKTVIGALHLQRDIPCQDCSASFEGGNGAFHIIAVADGHGDPSCFRSDRGAKLAVSSAMETLEKFAENKLQLSDDMRRKFFLDMFDLLPDGTVNPKNQGRYRSITMKNLSDEILQTWRERVQKDFESSPPSAETLKKYAYITGAAPTAFDDRFYHIYGTTLMAALWMPPILLLLHQGDGRIEIIYEDGRADQPVPWDEKCEANVTTSLCEKDAASRFRSKALNLEETPVIACYLGCDGVEDAYRDTYDDLGGSHSLMGGVHTFYKHISCLAAERDKADLERYLGEKLPAFSASGFMSRTGSGDDVSVAGIVNPERLHSYTGSYKQDIRRYGAEEELSWKQEELNSKTRKHESLRKKMEGAREAVNQAFRGTQDQACRIQALKKDEEGRRTELEHARKEKADFDQDKQGILSGLAAIPGTAGEPLPLDTLLRKRCISAWNDLHESLNNQEIAISAHCETLREDHEACCETIRREEAKLERMQAEHAELERNFNDAKAAFQAFDDIYRSIQEEGARIRSELGTLS